VLADAATSVLALVALSGGKYYGWNWLDPAMGLFGAALVGLWAWSLMRDTGRVLLDCEMDRPIARAVVACLENHPDWPGASIADVHLWRVGRAKYARILSLVTDSPGMQPHEVRMALGGFAELVHVTVEVNRCRQSIK
jgi:Co/Zn/Cd efflux system component